MRALAGLALFAALVLSGCSADDGDATTGPDAGTTTGLPTGTDTPTTSRPANLNNRPPTGSIAASVPGGDLPLQVTFTMTASDPDNDALSWTLDVDDDKQPDATEEAPASFPATFQHTYNAPGTFNVTYTILDGSSTVSYGVTINVTGTLPSQSVTGGWTASSAGCMGPYDTWAFGTPGNGVGWQEFDVDAATIGRPFHIEFESDSPVEVVGVDFYSADGMTRVGGMFDTAPFGDVVPEGAVLGLVTDCAGANFTFTYQTA